MGSSSHETSILSDAAMHLLFVHPNFPAQFGPFAFELAKRPGFRCTFVSQKPAGIVNGVRCIQYATNGGATAKSHYCSRTFENATWHAAGAYDALAKAPDVKPDVIIGHSGFGSTLFLKDLYPGTPVVNLFEYFYRGTDSDLDFRPDFPPKPEDRLRARARNAMILLDLHNCDRGYCPTEWQRSQFPAEYQSKLATAFDGIDTTLWKPDPAAPRVVQGRIIPASTKIVTYVSRGFESMRGFDIFLKAAKEVCDRRADVLFVVVGSDRICYGGDERFTEGKSFREWCWAKDDFDSSKFFFTGLLPTPDLASLFAITDAHVYLTVPFVLSWSLLNAMACGAPIIASDTAPVRELVEHEKTGLLVPFFAACGFAGAIEKLLREPERARKLGNAATEKIASEYRLSLCLKRFLTLVESVSPIKNTAAPSA